MPVKIVPYEEYYSKLNEKIKSILLKRGIEPSESLLENHKKLIEIDPDTAEQLDPLSPEKDRELPVVEIGRTKYIPIHNLMDFLNALVQYRLSFEEIGNQLKDKYLFSSFVVDPHYNQPPKKGYMYSLSSLYIRENFQKNPGKLGRMLAKIQFPIPSGIFVKIKSSKPTKDLPNLIAFLNSYLTTLKANGNKFLLEITKESIIEDNKALDYNTLKELGFTDKEIVEITNYIGKETKYNYAYFKASLNLGIKKIPVYIDENFLKSIDKEFWNNIEKVEPVKDIPIEKLEKEDRIKALGLISLIDKVDRENLFRNLLNKYIFRNILISVFLDIDSIAKAKIPDSQKRAVVRGIAVLINVTMSDKEISMEIEDNFRKILLKDTIKLKEFIETIHSELKNVDPNFLAILGKYWNIVRRCGVKFTKEEIRKIYNASISSGKGIDPTLVKLVTNTNNSKKIIF